jgi:putative DNA primase/helicase
MRDIHQETTGRWASLLTAIGIDSKFLRNKQGPCPICSGHTRFRFDDRAGRGTWICNHCGAGNGVDLVMQVKAISFPDAVTLLREYLPQSTVSTPRRASSVDPSIYRNLWTAATPLGGDDPASAYLISRGFLPKLWPKALKYVPRMTYRHEDGSRSEMPAMLAMFVAPDMSTQTWHITYLTPDGVKADVPKPKVLARLPVPSGGAVRLAPSSDTMGVAEGIETALSQMVQDDIPVWAALSSNGLIKFEAPETCKNLIIYGDNDASFTGQYAAFSLAYKAKQQRMFPGGPPRFESVEVRIPGLMCDPELIGADWNDLLMVRNSNAGAMYG